MKSIVETRADRAHLGRASRSRLLRGSLVVLLSAGVAESGVVDILDDTGPGSLRQTIADASAGELITFDYALAEYEAPGWSRWSEGLRWVERVHCSCTVPANSPVNRCGTFADPSGRTVLTNCLYVAWDTDASAGDTRPEFRFGIAQVMTPSGQCAFINTNADILVTSEGGLPPYADAGLIPQKHGSDLYGYVDRTGEFAIAPEFQHAEYFVRVYDASGLFSCHAKAMATNGMWGIIDTNGAFSVVPVYDDIKFTHSGPLVVASKEGKSGLVSIVNGDVIVDLKYDFIRPAATFGLRPVQLNAKWGVLTEADQFLVPPIYNEVDQRSYSNMTECITMRGGTGEYGGGTILIQEDRIGFPRSDTWYSLSREFSKAAEAVDRHLRAE